jgi:hypothetical protein
MSKKWTLYPALVIVATVVNKSYFVEIEHVDDTSVYGL